MTVLKFLTVDGQSVLSSSRGFWSIRHLLFVFQEYLENLDPFEGRTDKEIEDYLYNLSLEVEPRNQRQPLKHVSTCRMSVHWSRDTQTREYM